jgi:hypothetical protein
LGEEFIELYNVSPTNVNLAGWHFNKGVNFTLPSIDLASGGYLVVSANTNVFRTRYPGVNNVVGNWAGTLANNGETIELKNATGDVMDTVTYASEGDWAVRRRGLPDVGHRGWKWYAEADGLGKSMERRNPGRPASRREARPVASTRPTPTTWPRSFSTAPTSPSCLIPPTRSRSPPGSSMSSCSACR